MALHKTRLLTTYPSLLSSVPFVIQYDRGVHTQKVTKNIHYISNDNLKDVIDIKTMKLNRSPEKPVCIMLNWLQAKQKQVMKYVNLYLDEGFDVIRVFCEPWQLLWPRKGVQLLGHDLIKLMAANEGSYVIHGFSVGGYVWSEAMVQAMKDRELYQPVLDRVEAQVWDSVADITEIPVGLPLALFPTNKLAQHATKMFIDLYLRAFYEVGTRHYEHACATYYATPCRAPALFLLSSVDPVGCERRIRRAYNLWLDMGIQCTWKCWPNSAHVMHYVTYPDEYAALLRTHLRNNVSALRTCAPRSQSFERVKARL